ncbi:hypothetical protein ACFSOZ_23035 [Mesorhizobium newzealandense]|uniref:Uncharacterized protein n=1 Tax=Mesorhizobium newzealandense TaxID=1300302 RepID=A0ABW4UEI7_9HYPH
MSPGGPTGVNFGVLRDLSGGWARARSSGELGHTRENFLVVSKR